MVQPRFYRAGRRPKGLLTFVLREDDQHMFVAAPRDLTREAMPIIKTMRQDIVHFAAKNPEFYTALTPIELPVDAPPIVREMTLASLAAGVGPMAALSGAIAHLLGDALCQHTDEVMIEHGGDMYLRLTRPVTTIGLYAGPSSPFTGRIGFRIPAGTHGLCTSAGSHGPGFSFGKADAAVVIADSTALADAVATGLGNRVTDKECIGPALKWAMSVPGVRGALVTIGRHIGKEGEMSLVKLEKS